MSSVISAIENMQVINIDARHINPNLAAWNSYDTVFLSTCSRKLWLGTPRTLESFPRNIEGDKQRQYTGKDAYDFLLRVKSGLTSIKLGETNIDGDFIRACEAFAERQPEAWKAIAKTMQMMQADVRHIRTHFIDKIEKGTIENAAKKLAGVQRGDTILIVGKAGRNGSVSQITIDLACTVTNAARILYTSADPEAVESMSAKLQAPNIRKKISASTQLIPVNFSDMRDIIKSGCHVFIDFPMGETVHTRGKISVSVNVDVAICSAWGERPTSHHSLVHLRGCPSLRGDSTAFWKNACLPSYFSPEEVRSAKIQIDEHNYVLTQEAEKACQIIADARSNGSASYAHKLLGGNQRRDDKPQELGTFLAPRLDMTG